MKQLHTLFSRCTLSCGINTQTSTRSYAHEVSPSNEASFMKDSLSRKAQQRILRERAENEKKRTRMRKALYTMMCSVIYKDPSCESSFLLPALLRFCYIEKEM
jgi:hypothetical protein